MAVHIKPDKFLLFYFFFSCSRFSFKQLKVSFYRKAAMQNRYTVLFGMRNVTIDLCKYLSGTVGSNFMNFIINDLKSTSNLVHPCPFTVRSSEFPNELRIHL